ncbi:hypothetical protein M9H77_23893 [Catharanthus roseus]|uniref:Uncharacterized protein n=1 Tax=Catharanthus roseus TaxID=4058 RepID=A0ACC0AUL5_CATRO|nr:hypothetical protein M9H77_23893 [Catharanthus roseus]
MLVDKLNALFTYSLLSLEYLGNFPSIVSFNDSISNVARLCLLFEGMDLKTNPFKGGVDAIARSITRAMARRMEEEQGGKIARFKKMNQDLAGQMIGDQEEDFNRSKTVLWSSVQLGESKKANLGSLEASKILKRK